MFYRSCIVIALLFFMPLSAWSSENKAEGKNESANKSLWSDIKNAPGPAVANIPEQYNEIIGAFKAYWDAYKDRDFEKTYSMESSDFRKKMSLDLYRERHKMAVILVSMRPLEVKPINEKEVIIKAGFGYKAGFIDTVRFIDDRWIKEDEAWRHLPEKEKDKKK